MHHEILKPNRGTPLRKNTSHKMSITIHKEALKNIFLVNDTLFITESITTSDLLVPPHGYYMLINNGQRKIEIEYASDILSHEIIYDPYKFEHNEKVDIDIEEFVKLHYIPDGFTKVLSKWYSIKFTYSDYSLIFIKPEMGISIQIHDHRSEHWEVLQGEPIIINGNHVYYFVKTGTEFHHAKNTYHSVINPNKAPDKFAIIKERWGGDFDEGDVIRVFNPNNYQ